MSPIEFYRRVVALAIYEQNHNINRTAYILGKVLAREYKDLKEMVRFVGETIDRFILLEDQLLEVVVNNWYLITADSEQPLHDHFLRSLTPERASAIFEAQEKWRKRKERTH